MTASSGTMSIAGNFSSGGTFNHNNGTYTFTGTGSHTLSGATTWNNLNFSETTNNGTTSTITFPAGVTQTIVGILDMDGLDANDLLTIVSSSAASAATINFTGTSSFTTAGFLSVQDGTVTESSSNVTLPLNPANSTNVSGNTGWFGITVSGTAYSDEGVTALANGTTIKLLINGVAGGTTTVAGGAGAYSISASSAVAVGDILTVFVDGATEDGVTITKADSTSANVTSLNIYQDRLIINDTDDSITLADIDTGNDGDADIITIITNVAAGQIQSGKELYVAASTTFAPGAALDVNGDIEVVATGTLNAAANAVNVAGNFINAGTLTFTAGTDLTFDGTTQTFTPTATAIGADVIINSGSTVTLGSTLNNGTNDLTVAGTLGLNTRTLTTDVISNTGTITLTGNNTLTIGTQDVDSGTWEYTGDTDGTTDTWTIKDFGATDYFNLTINDNDATSDVFDGAAALTVAGALTVTDGAMTMTTNNLTVTGATSVVSTGSLTSTTGTEAFTGAVSTAGTLSLGSGATTMGSTLAVTAGTLTASTTSTAVTGTTTISGGTYTAGTATSTLTGAVTVSGGTLSGSTGTLSLGNNLLMSSGAITLSATPITVAGTTTLSGGTYTPSTATNTHTGAFTISGATYAASAGTRDFNSSVTISSGTMNASSGTMTIAGDFTHSGGTFTHNSGTVTFDPSVSHTITGTSTWNNINFSETSNNSTTSTITFAADQTVVGIADFDGLDANDLLSIRSSSGGVARTLTISGTGNVTSAGFLDIQDSTLTDSGTFAPPVLPASSTDSGNNSNWFTLAGSISIAGNVYTDEGTTAIANGTTVRLLLDGVSDSTTTTSGGTGAYSFSNITAPAGTIIAVHIDGAAEDGVSITNSDGTNITGQYIYQDRLVIKDADDSITLANLNTANDGSDTDVTNIYADGAGAVVASGKKLYIGTATTFAPGAALDSNGSIEIMAQVQHSMLQLMQSM
jgi:hypothetical protein